ncbi:HAD-IA family hydrolase [Altererythrobacter sp.]|uniref:HAD-IA family hydrolase n=1 Tax=Altererythrobacter sp. TaxID=1872480 RepID=UPI001B07704A|nr:HAD-IA family hydrolase [Altererythrobacter sp.]MBO6608633.1 HAD-IA family hydrolase [Altererythrobacter sp.]MBO6642887.1 HAD-IA family hydrolase [Altererythrobacter sp.]MBO6709630.1 HAD-IA family hydrolase [Altererythrobacter sp.]
MTDFPFDGVGFDLDGTLLDTFRDLGAAVNHALKLGGLKPVPVDSSKDLIGGGAKIMLAKAVEEQGGMPEDDFRALYKEMLRYYAEHNAVYTAPYPHAERILDELTMRGVRMAVVTNKFEEFATKILTEIGLAHHFVAIIGGDSMGRGEDGRFLAKPAPDPVIEAQRRCEAARFVFVGDSTYDVKAARGAGVPIIGAAYGYCDRDPHELGANAVIDSLDALIPALESL